MCPGNEQEETTARKDQPYPHWLLVDMPVVSYRNGMALQKRLLNARIADPELPDAVLLLEHKPVFTLGRRGGRDHLMVEEDLLHRHGIDLVDTERGGFITYHGPGQLVAYPIVNIRRRRQGVADFVSSLEEVMIRTAARWGIVAQRRPEYRGVWIGDRKLGSIGIAVRRGVTFHGLAINIKPDLTPFTWINPCGIEHAVVTSLEAEGATDAGIPDARHAVKRAFESVFGVRFLEIDTEEFSKTE